LAGGTGPVHHAGVWTEQPRHDEEESGLPRPGRTGEPERLSRADLQVEAAENANRSAAPGYPAFKSSADINTTNTGRNHTDADNVQRPSYGGEEKPCGARGWIGHRDNEQGWMASLR